MDGQRILSSFIGGENIKGLSREHAVKEIEIRKYLVSMLGRRRYLEIAHSNGGKAVAKKLTEPSYRLEYSRKMSLSVKESLGAKMQGGVFRAAWLAKARQGSKVGIWKLQESMKDLKFHEEWVGKCRAAGKTSYMRCVGIHKASPGARREWSVRGLRRTGKKLVGPHGEKMYNRLEVSVARVLDRLGLEYVYEKILEAKNKNGFLSIDFVLPSTPNLFIEATYWTNSEEKIRELRKKWGLIKNQYPNAKLIVVTDFGRLEDYCTLAQIDINVFTLIMLERHLIEAKLAG